MRDNRMPSRTWVAVQITGLTTLITASVNPGVPDGGLTVALRSACTGCSGLRNSGHAAGKSRTDASRDPRSATGFLARPRHRGSMGPTGSTTSTRRTPAHKPSGRARPQALDATSAPRPLARPAARCRRSL
jgi:hypothetical protein